MLRFSLPLIPTAVMWWVTGLSSGFFIERFMDIDATGIFKAAYRFPNIIIIISLIFSQAWNMSAITEKNSRTISRFYSNVFNIFQSAVYIMAAGLMLVIRPALVLMTRADFHGAYKFSAFLIMAVIFSCFSTFSGSVYVASKKSMRSMVTAFIGAVLNIGLNFALIPLWGLQGAAIATFFSYIVVFIVRAADTRKIVLMDLKIPKMTVNMIILLAMTAIIMTVGNSALYYTGLSVLFAVALIINFRSAISAIKLIKESKSQ
jgi:O-antigen/teichoic acid export membrane protein